MILQSEKLELFRTFLNKGITTKKYYERLSPLEWEDGSLDSDNTDNDELSEEIKKAKENEKPQVKISIEKFEIIIL